MNLNKKEATHTERQLSSRLHRLTHCELIFLGGGASDASPMFYRIRVCPVSERVQFPWASNPRSWVRKIVLKVTPT